MNKKLVICAAMFMVVVGPLVSDTCLAVPTQKSVPLNDDEKKDIKDLTNNIQVMFSFIEKHITKFLTGKDEKSPTGKDESTYSQYVQEFSTNLDNFEARVFNPLKVRIVDAQKNGTVSFYKGLVVVYEVMNDFVEKLHKLRTVLKGFDRDIPSDRCMAEATRLGNAIKPILLDIISQSTVAGLKKNIGKLCNILSEAGETELAGQLKQLEAVIANLNVGSANLGSSDTRIVLCIKRKLAKR